MKVFWGILIILIAVVFLLPVDEESAETCNMIAPYEDEQAPVYIPPVAKPPNYPSCPGSS